MHILFIGNSHTYLHNMPQVLSRLVQVSDPKEHLEVETSTGEGVGLAWHWNDTLSRYLISAYQWDYVVLQGRSGDPLEALESMHYHARLFDAEIKKKNAQTVFFMTWANRKKPETQKIITEAYEAIAADLKAVLAPVGLVWERKIKLDPELVLHAKDNRHANPLGAYLTACVFYSVFFGATPEGLPWVESEKDKKSISIEPDKLRQLQRIAFEARKEC